MNYFSVVLSDWNFRFLPLGICFWETERSYTMFDASFQWNDLEIYQFIQNIQQVWESWNKTSTTEVRLSSYHCFLQRCHQGFFGAHNLGDGGTIAHPYCCEVPGIQQVQPLISTKPLGKFEFFWGKTLKVMDPKLRIWFSHRTNQSLLVGGLHWGIWRKWIA